MLIKLQNGKSDLFTGRVPYPQIAMYTGFLSSLKTEYKYLFPLCIHPSLQLNYFHSLNVCNPVVHRIIEALNICHFDPLATTLLPLSKQCQLPVITDCQTLQAHIDLKKVQLYQPLSQGWTAVLRKYLPSVF